LWRADPQREFVEGAEVYGPHGFPQIESERVGGDGGAATQTKLGERPRPADTEAPEGDERAYPRAGTQDRER
jgi:hypothetical protein